MNPDATVNVLDLRLEVRYAASIHIKPQGFVTLCDPL